MTKVLVIGTSRKTRGGITSVIKAHETGVQWKAFECEWIETHIDGSSFQKINYFIRGFVKFLFKFYSVNIVHIHLAAVERKMPFIFFSKLLRKKVIVHLHFPDPSTTIDNPSKSWKYGWCIRKADITIALSDTWKKLLEQKYNVSNIRVLYNPCPKVNNLPSYNERLSGNKYILYAGNLSIRKGYRDLLIAFAEVANQIPEWSIKFAGNGEIDQAKKIARQLGIEKRVKFLGWISGEEKDEAFRKASCYCLPSYAEGFPMGVLDAWAYGLPVITTPVGGLPEILKDSKNSLVFCPGDKDGLKEKLLCLRDPVLLETLSAASTDLAKGKFNIDNINYSLGNIYSELIPQELR